MNSKQIMQKLSQASQAKITNYPCNNIRASMIGHPCERYLVYSISNWEDKKSYDVGLQNIFDLGNALEGEVIRRLKEAGFELLTGRKNFKIDKPLITGREDIMLQDPESGELYPCEIKGLAPVTFDKLNSISDTLHHKTHYIRQYPAQLQTYMLHHNKEKGFLILFNKLNGAIKIIDMMLDYDYAESLLQKAERVYRHIVDKTLPPQLEEENICASCSFLHICGARVDMGNAVIDTGELEELLQRREELLPLAKELGEVQAQIKHFMRNNDMAVTANYIVHKKTIVRRPFVVAGSIYTKEAIKKIGGTKHEVS